MKELRVLSLGAGVQSSTLLLLSLRGELPPLDAAIFADTQWEPPAVYEHCTCAEWRAMRDCDPASWADAVAFDRAIRATGGARGDVYLHPARVPLDEAPIDTDDPRQGTLFSCGTCDT